MMYRESLLITDFGGKGKPRWTKSVINKDLFSTKAQESGKMIYKVHFLGIFPEVGPFSIHQVEGI